MFPGHPQPAHGVPVDHQRNRLRRPSRLLPSVCRGLTRHRPRQRRPGHTSDMSMVRAAPKDQGLRWRLAERVAVVNLVLAGGCYDLLKYPCSGSSSQAR